MGKNVQVMSESELKKFLKPFLVWCKGKYDYVLHVHYASVLHFDLRMLWCGPDLLGVTLFSYKDGTVKKRPNGREGWKEFEEIINNPRKYFKLDYTTGEFTEAGRRSLGATVKLPEPCLGPGSFVWCSNTIKRVEDVSVGDLVLDANGNWTRVLHKYAIFNPTSRLFKITPVRGTPTIVTENHLILTAQFITKGRIINNKTPYHKVQELIDTNQCKVQLSFKSPSEINEFDYLVFPRLKSNPTQRHLEYWQREKPTLSRLVKIKLGRNFGFFVGILLSDGYVHNSTVSVTTASPGLERIRSCFEEVGKVIDRKVHVYSNNGYFTVMLIDVGLAELLNRIANNKAIDFDWLLSCPRPFLEGLADGLDYGDGDTNTPRFRNTRLSLIGLRAFLQAVLHDSPVGVSHASKEKEYYSVSFNKADQQWISSDKFVFTRIARVEEVEKIPYVINLETESGTFCCVNFATHNSAWLKVEKFISPPGWVGARSLKRWWGYMKAVDRGKVQHLTRKIDEFEFYFTEGKAFRGRYILRPYGPNFKFFSRAADKPLVVGTRISKLSEGLEIGGFLWIKCKDQTPYVLSQRAIKKVFISPKGFSGVPIELERFIPSDFQYWKFTSKQKRITVRNKLVDVLHELRVIKALRNGDWEAVGKALKTV